MAEAATPSSSRPPNPATVGDIMETALTTAHATDHIAAAAYLMKHAGATALVVVDDEEARRPLGLVTEADIVRAVAEGKDVNDVRIRDLMTARPTVITAATSVRDAAESMLASHFRHLPVVSEGGLIGIVDIGDVCRALLDPPLE
jgi:CBS domain-containing protein